MGSVIGDVLPIAVGVAVSPVPVIALILMLFSKRARANGPAFAAGWVVGIAAVLAAVNLKNLLLIVGAAITVAQAGLPAGQATVAFAVFTLIASLTVIVPVVAYLALGDRAARVLEELKGWLSQNNAAVMAVLLLVFGVVLLGKGISGLTT